LVLLTWQYHLLLLDHEELQQVCWQGLGCASHSRDQLLLLLLRDSSRWGSDGGRQGDIWTLMQL
jgi:hypothetical protein